MKKPLSAPLASIHGPAMLLRLAIKNLATISDLSLDFSPGFSVITGETGAGKSILIDALSLVLGGKIQKDYLREGEERVVLEALFDIENLPRVHEILAELEVPHQGDLVLRRILAKGMRSRIMANDCLISQARLERLFPLLVAIHGQRDNHTLLDPATHEPWLDAYAGLKPRVEAFRLLHQEYQARVRELQRLEKEREKTLGETEGLRHHFTLLQAANLRPGEEEELRERLSLLEHTEQLTQLTGSFLHQVFEQDQATFPALSRAFELLESSASLDKSLLPLLQEAKPALFLLEELERPLRRYLENLELDPQALEALHARLAELENLKRRYGKTIDEVLEKLVLYEKSLKEHEERQTCLQDLKVDLEPLAKELHAKAKALSNQRREAAALLTKRLGEVFQDLGLEKAVFEVAFEVQLDAKKNLLCGPTGMDRIQFLFSANPGSSPKPLQNMASGGELSRIMLSLKSILAPSDFSRTLVFDEVDAGVSGALAEQVGLKLRELGEGHQVLCITHLPQIAALADQHLYVEKHLSAKQAETQARTLVEEEKITELARLLSGVEVNAHSLAAARALRTQGMRPQPPRRKAAP